MKKTTKKKAARPIKKDIPRNKVTVVNNRNKKLRAFYRAYILPAHIEKRSGETKVAMLNELAGHLEDIKNFDLEEEYGLYSQARADLQYAYDDWRMLVAESRNLTGEELLPALYAASVAEQTFRDQKAAFTAQYQ